MISRCLCPAIDLSHCYHVERTKSICVSQEGKSFLIECDNTFLCWVFTIDDGLLKHATYSRRCDYGLYVHDKDSVYLVELKGRKFNDAIEQINDTINLLSNFLKNFSSVYVRIVAYQSAPRSIKYSMTKLDKLLHIEYNGDFDWTANNTLVSVITLENVIA